MCFDRVLLPTKPVTRSRYSHPGKGQPIYICLCDHSEIRPPPCRLKIRKISRTSLTATDRHMHGPETFLAVAVVIFCNAIPCLTTCVDEGLIQRITHVVTIACRQRASSSSISVATHHPALGTLEVGQTIGITPSSRAFIFPLIKIVRVTPHVYHPIDGR